jgi:hypothetical protein
MRRGLSTQHFDSILRALKNGEDLNFKGFELQRTSKLSKFSNNQIKTI